VLRRAAALSSAPLGNIVFCQLACSAGAGGQRLGEFAVAFAPALRAAAMYSITSAAYLIGELAPGPTREVCEPRRAGGNRGLPSQVITLPERR